MEISERLKTVASFVRTSRTIADIGTDHGYIPIYLCLEEAIDRAIACDVNREPVRRAECNINMYHLGNMIETRLGDGLKPLKAGEVEGAVIAGMGGMLIIEILDECLEKTGTLNELVLQPQIDVDKVRKYLHKIGFKIDDEEMIYEDGIYYNVIRAVHGREKYDNEADYIFGKINIDRKNAILKEFIEKEMAKNKKIMEKLKEAGTDNSQKRIRELEKYEKICEGVYECL